MRVFYTFRLIRIAGGQQMPWETEETKEFDTWFDSLNQDDQIQVIAAVQYLTEHGPAARMPVSAPIRQPNSCGMKELRPGSSARSELRILYAFDPQRKAILLLGGDKSARRNDWSSWYDRNVPIAELLFTQHIQKSTTEQLPTSNTKQPRTPRRRRTKK